jgi:F-type H+-transporting ATPase subunit a
MLPVLAAANPLDHVVDQPLFHFEEGHDYAWQIWLHHHFGGLSGKLWGVGIGKHFVIFCLAGLITLLVFWIRARQVRTEVVPGRFGMLIETVMVFLRDNVARPFLGDHCEPYLPFIWGFFFFILFNNLLGLIPLFDYLGHGGNTATANIGITAALALSSFLLYHLQGMRAQGSFFRYFKNLFPHVPAFIYPIIVPVELIAHVVKPCALAIRLCANMVAGHTLMAAILGFTVMSASLPVWGWGGISLISLLATVALNFLELLVALIQAFVFTFLSTVFLGMAVHPEH